MGNGEQAELLFSVTVFSLARSRGIDLSLEDSTDIGERLKFFAKIFYLGALNAWEYRLLDDPSLGEMPFRVIDFAQWMGDNPKEAARLIQLSSAAISGKDLGKDEVKEDGEDVKKKSTSTSILKRLRAFLSGIAARLSGRSGRRP